MINIDELPPSLYEAEVPEDAGGDTGIYMYAKRPANGQQPGWIVQVPAWHSAESNYSGRGFKYLTEYGHFVVTSADKRVNEYARIRERDAVGRPWHTYHEPYRMLFQRGGAKEFPLEQIVASHWHIKPPYRDIEFPALNLFYQKGGHITDYECPECDQRIVVFSSENPREAARMLRIHLTSAINDRHKYSITDLRELGKEWGIDFESSRVGRLRRLPVAEAIPDPAPVDVIAQGWSEDRETEEDLLDHAFECDGCGWAPLKTNKNKEGALRFHKFRCPGRPA